MEHHPAPAPAPAPAPPPLNIPPRVPLSLIWLRATFNSRSRTEELFRPELENGILTQHDFNAAVDFLPGPQRYYTIAGGIIGTLYMIFEGRVLRRPPLPVDRIALRACLAAGGGIVVGTTIGVNAFSDFVGTLDSRPAFIRALLNIQSRLGDEPLRQHTGHAFPRTDSEVQGLADSTSNSEAWGYETPINRTAADRPPGPTRTLPHKSRWEEIRAEHARSMATRSSWDELRQNANRPKSENTGTDQAETSRDSAAERLAEQEKFDAILDAERRRAAKGS